MIGDVADKKRLSETIEQLAQRARAILQLAVCCKVCRNRDWNQGGLGRADRVGQVVLTSDGWTVYVVRRGWASSPISEPTTKPTGRINAVVKATREKGLEDWSDQFRARCRRGHRINVEPAELGRKIDTAVRKKEEAVYV